MSETNSVRETACEQLARDGFLLLKTSDTTQDKIRATFVAASAFFQEPLHVKTLDKLPEDAGYRPFGIEYSQSAANPDQIESFSVSIRSREAQQGLHSASARILYERMLDMLGILEPIAETLTIQLANALSTQPIGKKLQGAFHRWSRLQLNYSRPAEIALPFVNESHEDGNLLTIACATGPGLELQTDTNTFLPMTTALGEVIIMPGEIASLLSGGYIRPLHHRVRPEPDYRERMALLYFGDIDPGLCQPWIVNDINKDIDIGARVLSSVTRFGLTGFTLE